MRLWQGEMVGQVCRLKIGIKQSPKKWGKIQLPDLWLLRFRFSLVYLSLQSLFFSLLPGSCLIISVGPEHNCWDDKSRDCVLRGKASLIKPFIICHFFPLTWFIFGPSALFVYKKQYNKCCTIFQIEKTLSLWTMMIFLLPFYSCACVIPRQIICNKLDKFRFKKLESIFCYATGRSATSQHGPIRNMASLKRGEYTYYTACPSSQSGRETIRLENNPPDSHIKKFELFVYIYRC